MNERVPGPSTSAIVDTATSSQLLQVIINRQPIYTLQQCLYAYSLQNPAQTAPQPFDEEQAQNGTPELISNIFAGVGLDTIVGHHYAMLQLSRGLLLMDYAEALPADRVILEVSDFTPLDAELAEVIHEFTDQGYQFALNVHHDDEDANPLLEVAAIIKVDLQTWTRDQLQEYLPQWRQYKSKIMAANVNTETDFAYCQALEMDYVQGPCVGQVETLTYRRCPTNRSVLLNLMTALIDPCTQRSKIEDIVSRDPTLSYKLLRLIRTTATGEPPVIAAISQAVQTLGSQSLLTWISLMLISGMDDSPSDPETTALVRAKMCKLLAQGMRLEPADAFFLVGLLSTLDDLLEMPMPELLDRLPIADVARQALEQHEGELGRILHAVLAYEQGNWEDIHELGIDSSAITDNYLRALVWAETPMESS